MPPLKTILRAPGEPSDLDYPTRAYRRRFVRPFLLPAAHASGKRSDVRFHELFSISGIVVESGSAGKRAYRKKFRGDDNCHASTRPDALYYNMTPETRRAAAGLARTDGRRVIPFDGLPAIGELTAEHSTVVVVAVTARWLA